MKRITLLMLLMAVNAHAGICGGNFWTFGEAVLWRPTVEQSYYAIISKAALNSPNGRQIALETGYRWGYRIGIGYCRCNKDIKITWASLNTTFASKVSAIPPDSLWPTQLGPGEALGDLSPGTASTRHSFNYDVLHGDLGFHSCPCSQFSMRWFGGVAYASINSRQPIDYEGISTDSGLFESAFTVIQSEIQGVGPRLGVYLDCDLWCGLAFEGSVAGSFLIGSSKGLFLTRFPQSLNVNSTIHNTSQSHITPSCDLRFGFAYATHRFCRFTPFAALGYEIHYYLQGRMTINVENTTTNRGLNRSTSESFVIDGFYFRLGTAF